MARADWSVDFNFDSQVRRAQSVSPFTSIQSTHNSETEKIIFDVFRDKNPLDQSNEKIYIQTSESLFLTGLYKSGENVLIYWNGSDYHFYESFLLKTIIIMTSF